MKRRSLLASALTAACLFGAAACNEDVEDIESESRSPNESSTGTSRSSAESGESPDARSADDALPGVETDASCTDPARPCACFVLDAAPICADTARANADATKVCALFGYQLAGLCVSGKEGCSITCCRAWDAK